MAASSDRASRRAERPSGNLPASFGATHGEVSLDALPGYLGYNLRQTQVAVFKHFTARLRRFDITPGQFGLMVLLAANPGISQVALSRALRRDKSTLTSAIDLLERRGLVSRSRSAGDRRSYAVRLTPAGGRLVARMRAMAEEHERGIAARLAPEERAQLIALLQRVQQGASAQEP